ncbi:MAG: K(+)-transporting ATPase subunit C [Candidatus Melainabacteria bacterium]|nr:MAG: K(+)-transporting ATPase subunit C [Candidatus Melainabacteria bacterium]
MLKELIPALRMTFVLALLTGLIFPLFITAVSQALFPEKANGSLVRNNKGDVVGSALLAQKFEAPKYFHPRPSAAGSGYAGEASGGTNLGPTSTKLIMGIADDPNTKADESFAGIKQLAESYRKENELDPNAAVPVDAVTRSASGLDPDISEANAMMQAPRVARARNLKADDVKAMIRKYRTDRDLQILGEPRLNVLTINMALDNIK